MPSGARNCSQQALASKLEVTGCGCKTNETRRFDEQKHLAFRYIQMMDAAAGSWLDAEHHAINAPRSHSVCACLTLSDHIRIPSAYCSVRPIRRVRFKVANSLLIVRRLLSVECIINKTHDIDEWLVHQIYCCVHSWHAVSASARPSVHHNVGEKQHGQGTLVVSW